MVTRRAAMAVVGIALGGQLAGGCLGHTPYVSRDPDGPCLQLPSRRHGKGSVSTLWRDDMFVGNVQPNGDGLDEALIGATSDNPAANAEARARRRDHVASTALIYGAPLAAIAAIAAGQLVTHDSEGAKRYVIGTAFVVDLAVFFAGGYLLDASYDHAHKAIAIYNADPPPGCGRPVGPPQL